MKEKNNLKKVKPAGYSKASSIEVKSRNVLLSLLDTNYIMDDIKIHDKIPNIDGTLEVLDDDGISIGKIELQLKTLKKANYLKPKYQCEKNFLLYCDNTILPVILVAVNHEKKCAYWLYIDDNVLLKVRDNIKRKTAVIHFPKENIIQEGDSRYISEWSKIINNIKEKVYNYDTLKSEKQLLEENLKEVVKRTQSPSYIPLGVVKDIYSFLDHYNYILDKEFKSIKSRLYPGYWKIGMGILKLEVAYLKYILFPIEYKKETALVSEVTLREGQDVFKDMLNGNVIMLANSSPERLKRVPEQYAYKLLESKIVDKIEKYTFPISNEFLAHEYLISFIDSFSSYLGFDEKRKEYDLKELKTILFNILPLVVANSLNFAENVSEHNFNIDHYQNFKGLITHRKLLNSYRNNNSQAPQVKVTVTSQLFDIDVIKYYIDYLERKGIKKTKRQYLLGQYDETNFKDTYWKRWVKNPLWENVKLFFLNIIKIYRSYLTDHFPLLEEELDFFPTKDTSLICVFLFDDSKQRVPQLELYFLRPYIQDEEGGVYCFLHDDPKNPIKKEFQLIENWKEIDFDGTKYSIILSQAYSLNFLFEKSPSYTFIQQELKVRLKKYFSKKTKGYY